MAKSSNKKVKIHNAIYEFGLFANEQIPILIENALLLKKYVPQNIKNPVLLFLLPRTLNDVLERLILEIEQAWRILNRELKNLGKHPLDKNDKDYKDLDKMRDKFIGHRIESSLATDKYQKWYEQNYGSYEKTFELIQRVATKIATKIEELMDEDSLAVESVTTKMPGKIVPEDISRLLDALKNAGIY